MVTVAGLSCQPSIGPACRGIVARHHVGSWADMPWNPHSCDDTKTRASQMERPRHPLVRKVPVHPNLKNCFFTVVDCFLFDSSPALLR